MESERYVANRLRSELMGRLPATVVSRFDASSGNVLGVSSFCFRRRRWGNISSSFVTFSILVLVSSVFEDVMGPLFAIDVLAFAPPSIAVDCFRAIGFHRLPLEGPRSSFSTLFAQKYVLSAAKRCRLVKKGTSGVDRAEVVMLRLEGCDGRVIRRRHWKQTVSASAMRGPFRTEERRSIVWQWQCQWHHQRIGG